MQHLLTGCRKKKEKTTKKTRKEKLKIKATTTKEITGEVKKMLT